MAWTKWFESIFCELKYFIMNDDNFKIWLMQFIKDYGHSFGFGSFVELNDGRVLSPSSDEYIDWYNDKKLEYEQK